MKIYNLLKIKIDINGYNKTDNNRMGLFITEDKDKSAGGDGKKVNGKKYILKYTEKFGIIKEQIFPEILCVNEGG